MENAAQKALTKLVEDTVALKLEAIRTAHATVSVEVLNALRRKELLSNIDIARLLALLDASAAALARTNPDTAREVAALALVLRHSLGDGSDQARQ